MIDSLYRLKLDDVFANSVITLHHNVGIKRGLINENSSIL